jgi:hypothetical protein
LSCADGAAAALTASLPVVECMKAGSALDDDAHVVGGDAAPAVIGDGGERHRALFLRRGPCCLRMGGVGKPARRGKPVIHEHVAVGVDCGRRDLRRLPDIDRARLARHGDGRCAVGHRLWIGGRGLGRGHRRARERCD